MDKRKLVDHIAEIENLRDMINHYLGGIQLHLDKMKKILDDLVITPEPKLQPLPSPIPLEKQQDRYLSDKEVSKITGIGVGTLRNDRSQRKGIPYVKPTPRMFRYKLSDVLAYMEQTRIDIEKPGRRK